MTNFYSQASQNCRWLFALLWSHFVKLSLWPSLDFVFLSNMAWNGISILLSGVSQEHSLEGDGDDINHDVTGHTHYTYIPKYKPTLFVNRFYWRYSWTRDDKNAVYCSVLLTSFPECSGRRQYTIIQQWHGNSRVMTDDIAMTTRMSRDIGALRHSCVELSEFQKLHSVILLATFSFRLWQQFTQKTPPVLWLLWSWLNKSQNPGNQDNEIVVVVKRLVFLCSLLLQICVRKCKKCPHKCKKCVRNCITY